MSYKEANESAVLAAARQLNWQPLGEDGGDLVEPSAETDGVSLEHPTAPVSGMLRVATRRVLGRISAYLRPVGALGSMSYTAHDGVTPVTTTVDATGMSPAEAVDALAAAIEANGSKPPELTIAVLKNGSSSWAVIAELPSDASWHHEISGTLVGAVEPDSLTFTAYSLTKPSGLPYGSALYSATWTAVPGLKAVPVDATNWMDGVRLSGLQRFALAISNVTTGPPHVGFATSWVHAHLGQGVL